jgi:hypothetical protein
VTFVTVRILLNFYGGIVEFPWRNCLWAVCGLVIESSHIFGHCRQVVSARAQAFIFFTALDSENPVFLLGILRSSVLPVFHFVRPACNRCAPRLVLHASDWIQRHRPDLLFSPLT